MRLSNPTPHAALIIVLTIITLLGICAAAISAVAGRDEVVLYHDDGTPETLLTGQTGMKAAVRFQAPPSVTHLVAVELYIMDDGVLNPNDPNAPTTMPMTLWVWKPGANGLPGALGSDGFVPYETYGCPEDTLVRFYLPEPIDITDNTAFPDRRFYVGLEWEYRLNPMIGVDTDDPAGCSFRWNWVEWEEVDGNIILRAVVTAEPSCVPEVILVDASGGGDYFTIGEAIGAAGDCDTILVAPGTYTGPDNRGLGFDGRCLVLAARDGRAETIIDCQHQGRAFCFVDGENESAVVRGFTVRNGSGSGGGIRCVNSWPTIEDCAFIDCDGESYGGGMYLNNAVTPSPMVERCLFAGNTAALSGGGVLMDFSDASFENCTFAMNAAPEGGAVACGAGSSPSFANCILAFSLDGEAADCVGTNLPSFTHCCVFGNAGGDSLCGDHFDNIFVDPLFCDPATDDYRLQEDSACAPGNNAWSELIGAYGAGCEPTMVEERSWGSIKAMFR